MNAKYNISTIFLLPGVEITYDLKKKLRSQGFVNTYLTCEPLTYPYPVIYLLFQPLTFDQSFKDFIDSLQKNNNFIEVVDLSKDRVMLVYRVPRKFRSDYELFMKGQYSKLSNEFKKCFILEDYKRENGKLVKDERGRPILEPNDFYHIFNKTDFFKNQLKDKLGYKEDSDIFDEIELYDVQDPLKESMSIDDCIW